MSLENEQQLQNTRKKLRDLEAMHESLLADAGEDDTIREHTLQSLDHLIKQLKEEIGRFQCRQPARP